MKKTIGIEASVDCILSCEKCITESLKKGNIECAKICRDCSSICEMYFILESRGSKFLKDIKSICVMVCKMCAVECSKFAAGSKACKDCMLASNLCAETLV